MLNIKKHLIDQKLKNRILMLQRYDASGHEFWWKFEWEK